MANSDKNIVITPNNGTASLPQMVFTGFNNTPITMRVQDSGALSYQGTFGELFNISDLSTSNNTLFSVGDISGSPMIEVLDTGSIILGQFNSNVGIGTGSPRNKLDVRGSFGRGLPKVISSGTTYTVLPTDNWIINNQGSTLTITLPSPALCPGREIMIKNVPSVTVNSASSNIASRSSATANTNTIVSGSSTWATLVSDGTQWQVMASNY
jgi:hypothetical protein